MLHYDRRLDGLIGWVHKNDYGIPIIEFLVLISQLSHSANLCLGI